MANGNIKCQSEYYSDPTTYPGSPGTSTNKAVIEDVFDLVAWPNIIDRDSRYDHHRNYGVLINDINFNDHPTYKYGVSGYMLSLSFRGWYGQLDGDGHSICNMIVRGCSDYIVGGYSSGVINNVKFKNTIAINQSVGIFTVSTFTNCDFAIFCSNSNPGHLINGTFTNCTFLLKGLCPSYVLRFVNGGSFTRCQFNLDMTNTSSGYDPGFQVGGADKNTRVNFTDCAIVGSTKFTTASSLNVFLTGINMSNSYIALTVPNRINYIGNNSDGVYANSCCFIDKDLLSNTPQSFPPNFYAITTEQAQSATYLNSIGFITV